jgi:hypothetical protein
MQKDGDIMEFYVSGDVAPGARFKYSFTTMNAAEPDTETDTAEPDTTAPDTQEKHTDAPSETEPVGKKGCKSSVAAGGLVAATMAAAALTLLKKKESEA